MTLSHYDDAGRASMVDVSGKADTRRTARAHAFVKMNTGVLSSDWAIIRRAIRWR